VLREPFPNRENPDEYGTGCAPRCSRWNRFVDPAAAVQSDVPPSGSLPVGSLQAGGDQLIISQVVFSPNPVTSQTRRSRSE
jgi:hypothetical protein